VAAPDLNPAPRFTVIVPTHRRRDLVLRLVRGLGDQEFRDFEAIVVVDGHDDATAAALRALATPFPLTVLEQPHGGVAAARNRGAEKARGDILLFLDDDMAPHPALLAEHDRSHRAGAHLVIGHLPLDPESPATGVAAAVGRWAERRRTRLATAESEVPVSDLLTGQMSVPRQAFAHLGGFDLAFTRGGLVPGADRDFGYRARKEGLRIVFNPAAISYQRYEVDASDYIRRTRNGARGDRILAARYPEIAGELWQPRFDTLYARITLGPLAALPRPLSLPVRSLAVRLFSRPEPGRWSNRLFFAVQTMERLRGLREGTRALRAPLAVVLAYHAADNVGESGAAPEGLARQLDRLLHDGWRFVALDRFLDALDGGAALPDRAVLLTFDDASLLTAARPILAERGIPAVVFVLGESIGSATDALRDAFVHGIAVGSRGATYRSFVDITARELERELEESSARIAAHGLPRPTVFAYPCGERNATVAAAVERAGFRAAFTLAPRAVLRSHDPYALPRIEVLALDSERALARKLRTAHRRTSWRAR
jgi:glycosyltransferase involved in cell wall biosynthesis/peptidoglycan/xylan/chitin deacetylase (PgdA/CDA1 family)